MKYALKTLAATLLFAAGCDSTDTAPADGPCVGDACDPRMDGTGPQVGAARLTALSLESGAPHPNHAITVAAEFEFAGEAFESEVIVGMRRADGTDGCLIGSIGVAHAPPGGDASAVAAVSARQELVVPALCARIAGEDLELFVAFDMFANTRFAERDARMATLELPEALPDEEALFVLAEAARMEGCAADDCAPPVQLTPSPGRNAQLRGVRLGSSVITYPIAVGEYAAIPAEAVEVPEGEAPAPVDAAWAAFPTDPHLEITTDLRVLGVAPEERVDQMDLWLTYEIRPAAELVDGDGAPVERDWRPLARERSTEAGAPELVRDAGPPPNRGAPNGDRMFVGEDRIFDLEGPDLRNHAAPVFVDGPLNDLIKPEGIWGGVDEFELRVCLNTTFEDAATTTDNCATMPVLMLREFYGPEGRIDVPADAAEGEYALENRNLWLNGMGYNADSGDGGFSAQIWLERGTWSSDSQQTHTTQWGNSLQGNGGTWIEAGLDVTADILRNQDVELAGAYVMGVDFAGGQTDRIQAYMALFGVQLVPEQRIEWPDGQITLEEILERVADARGAEGYDTTYVRALPLLGKRIETDCGGVTAVVEATLELGLSQADTSLTKSAVAPRVDPCADHLDTVVNGLCFFRVEAPEVESFNDYKARCRAAGGHAAPMRTAADLAMATQVADGQVAFVGVSSVLVPINLFNWQYLWQHTHASALGLAPRSVGPSVSGATGANRHVKIDAGGLLVSRAVGSLGRYGVCVAEKLEEGTSGGTELVLTVTPFIEAGVTSEVGAGLNFGFSSTSFGISLTLSLLNLSLPFVTDVTVEYKTAGGAFIEVGQQIYATLTALAGSADFWISWRVCFIFCKNGTHRKNIASWDGIDLGSWWLLPRTSFSRSF